MTVNYQGCGMEFWPDYGTSVVCLRSMQSKKSEILYPEYKGTTLFQNADNCVCIDTACHNRGLFNLQAAGRIGLSRKVFLALGHQNSFINTIYL